MSDGHDGSTTGQHSLPVEVLLWVETKTHFEPEWKDRKRVKKLGRGGGAEHLNKQGE